MMYLASTTRPDIAFAIYQCAHFTHNPKHSHEIALKQIGRYLAGLWNSENIHNPTCVKSRTGFLLTLGGSPLL
eukprot:10636505-Ditylum_brightwellii.AAC.1